LYLVWQNYKFDDYVNLHRFLKNGRITVSDFGVQFQIMAGEAERLICI